MNKLPVFILFLFLSAVAAGQKTNKIQANGQKPLPELSAKSKLPVLNAGNIVSEIQGKLDSLVNEYKSYPDNTDTWKKIRFQAENILYAYWRQGKLQGAKATEAYFVKMDNTTMTANDILNHKMILFAGVAPVKPVEFQIIRIEK